MEKKIKRTPCEIYARVTGWIVARSAANPGKQAEWRDRKQYKMPEDLK